MKYEDIGFSRMISNAFEWDDINQIFYWTTNTHIHIYEYVYVISDYVPNQSGFISTHTKSNFNAHILQ